MDAGGRVMQEQLPRRSGVRIASSAGIYSTLLNAPAIINVVLQYRLYQSSRLCSANNRTSMLDVLLGQIIGAKTGWTTMHDSYPDNFLNNPRANQVYGC